MRGRITVLPEFYLIMAAGVLLLPFKWLAAWIMAAFFHELCHYIALRSFGGRVFSIKIGMNGAVMVTDREEGKALFFSALAGPAGGLLLMLLLRVAPRVALCGLLQSAYNLLPVGALDGGRALSSVLRAIMPEQRATAVLRTVEAVILSIVLIAGVYGTIILRLGILPATAALTLIFRCKKIPCKEAALRVQ